MSGWLIEEVSGLYVVTAPGCRLVGHPEISPCDCAAFELWVEADRYARSGGRTVPARGLGHTDRIIERERKRQERQRKHAEWLAWKKARDTHRCGQCEKTSTFRGIQIHQGRTGHTGIGKLESAPA